MKKSLLIAPMMLAMGVVSAATHDQIWQNYCDSSKSLKRKSATIPLVNYQNELVLEAAKKLNQVEANSFYQYKEIEKIYGLCNGRSKESQKCIDEKVPKVESLELKVDTHNFLTILCGEFRDNVRMLKSKLEWVARMNIVQDGEQAYTKDKDVYEQITGQGYQKLVSFSSQLYSAREHALENAAPYLELKQNSVSAVTICENRYIFENFLSKNKSFYDTTLDEYEKGLEEYKKSCSKHDLSYYYEYRGDGNFKAHSLESNAFIFVARDFANSCSSLDKARRGTVLTDKDCSDYYSRPFKTRSEISKQGLRRLFFYPKTVTVGETVINVDEKMTDYKGELVFITEDLNSDKIADMIVLEESLQGEGDELSDRGAEALLDARTKVTSLRQDAQYEEGKLRSLYYQLATVYKKAVHYIASTAAISQLEGKTSKKNLERLKTASDSSKGYIKYKLARMSKDIEAIASEDDYTGDQLQEIVNELTEITNTTEFKGVIVITEVVEMENGKPAKYNSKLNEVFKKKEDAWHRVTVVLDRHTDWYQIDTINMSLAQYSPTYSPWVASSYYINKSDDFTKPGYAMGLPGDGHRHWMFVQKVPVDRWFNASHLRETQDWENYDLDIHNTWFDETTFSRSSLGQHEQGWDRFGTATYDEVGQIFYMWKSSELEE